MTVNDALICAFVNRKPGTGKTTTAAHVASAWARAHRRVLAVDADPAGSLAVWADLATTKESAQPWATAWYPKPSIRGNIVTVLKHSAYDRVVIDCPQMEDHEAIVLPALMLADVWVMTIAPAPIELNRALDVAAQMDKVDSLRDGRPGVRIALLNRTNKALRTESGPDASIAAHLEEAGFTVLANQVPHNDRLYRQTFGTWPADSPLFDRIATELEEVAA